MAEVPILFTGQMVNAILDGRKTQTRRLASNRNCARIAVGDTLWVRETWQELHIVDGIITVAYRASCPDDSFDFEHPIGGLFEQIQVNKWRPSIFMPRKYCRLELRVTAVRVEPLRSIKREDVVAEGLVSSLSWWSSFAQGWDKINNKPGARWDDNPDVRVIDFELLPE